MEQQKCKQCGRELPIAEFPIVGRSGAVMTICKDCFKARQKEGRKKHKELKEQEMQSKVETSRQLRLNDFTPRELMLELKRRGYSFKMEYTETHYIDSDKL